MNNKQLRRLHGYICDLEMLVTSVLCKIMNPLLQVDSDLK